jgi:hypothetical protein
LLYTDDYPRAWEVADEIGAPVADAFWRNFRTFGLGDFAHVDFATERLLSADRPGAALDLVALYTRQEDTMSEARAELVAEGLEALLRREAGDDEGRLLSHYDLITLFAAMEGSELPRERLAQLEWSYLRAFGIDARPIALSEMLAQDPNFFVEIIRLIYKPQSSSDDENAETEDVDTKAKGSDADADPAGDEQQAALAANAYHLLSDWNTVPGRREAGTLDPEALEAWVAEARRKLDESGHGAIGDSHIGRMLARVPADEDGLQPHLEVRNLLEKLQSSEIEDGLRVELYNNRGPSSRGLFDGGEQERALVARYSDQAANFTDRWPRTAALLRKLSEGYDREARRMDDEAERRRKGFEV